VTDTFEEPRVKDNFWFYDADTAGGGALIDMGVYAIANLVAVLGRVKNVTARMTTIDKPTTLEDTATLILEFENGALGTAETGWSDPARSSILRVHGTLGKLVKDNDEIEWIQLGASDREWAETIVERIAPSQQVNQHAEWLHYIEGKRQPTLSNIWCARHVTEIMLAAVLSNADGKRVNIQSSPTPRH